MQEGHQPGRHLDHTQARGNEDDSQHRDIYQESVSIQQKWTARDAIEIKEMERSNQAKGALQEGRIEVDAGLPEPSGGNARPQR